MISIGKLYVDLTSCMERAKPTVVQPDRSLELAILRSASSNLTPRVEIQRHSETRVGKRGRLAGIEVSLVSYETGLYDFLEEAQITGLAIIPARSASDMGAAMIEPSGRVTAAYYNKLSRYHSAAQWNTKDQPLPKSSGDIFQGLASSRGRIQQPHVLFGIEIAVRYLLETPTGLPLSYFMR